VGAPLQLEEVINSGELAPRTVKDILIEKHQLSMPIDGESIVKDSPQQVHTVVLHSLDDHCIRTAALRTKGAGGPSGIDALKWRKLYN